MLTARYYQEEGIKAPFDYWQSGGTGNPLLAYPTGTGKSLVIAFFIERLLKYYPSMRVLVLTHVKELIKQNSDKLKEVWPSAPYGILSAGLNQRDCRQPIIFGGVGTVVGQVEKLGHRDLLIIDEAHLLSGKSDSMYGVIIEHFKRINPNFKVLGLTATPYRLGQGLLTEGGIFTDIIVDWTSLEKFNQLLREGYLATLIPKRTHTTLDISSVGLGSDGDFAKGQLENAVDKGDLNYQICKEIVYYGQDRKSWMVFTGGVKHTDHITEMLRSFGVNAACAHSKMSTSACDEAIAGYRSGKYRTIVSAMKLTTGFDHPPTDLIADLAPTLSTGKHVQKWGRGTRPSPETGKTNCLGLDFAGNIPRLGPINDPVIPRPKGQGTPGTVPIKICEQCGCYCHAKVRFCENCGFEFPVHVKLFTTAGTQDLIKSDAAQLEWFNVQHVHYKKYIPKDKPAMLVATHNCGVRSFDDYVLLEHSGGIKHKAVSWWKKRMESNEAPPTVDEALKWTGMLRVPRRIQVHVNHKHTPIMQVEF